MVGRLLHAPRDPDVLPEHSAHAVRLRGDDGRSTRQAFECPAGEHRRRFGYRVHVQHDVVAPVGRQHLLVRKGSLDRLPVPVREMVVRSKIEREVAVEDVQTQRERWVKQISERLGTLWVLVLQPASGKTHRVSGPALLSRGIVQLGLCRERQDVYTVVSQGFPVHWKAVRIRREDKVELPGGPEEFIEVRRVLLIPEHRRNPGRAAILQKLPQRTVLLVLAAENQVPPLTVVAAEGRLDKQQLGLTFLYLGAPVFAGQQKQVYLVPKGVFCELVEDGCDRWAIGRSARDRQRGVADKPRDVQIKTWGEVPVPLVRVNCAIGVRRWSGCRAVQSQEVEGQLP